MVQRGADTFAYDALDRLTASTVGGVPRTYAYDGDGLLASRSAPLPQALLWDPATSPQRLLVAGTDRVVYGRGPLYIARADGTTSTLARDGLGSVRAEVSDLGLITGSYRYRAYGETAQASGLGPSLLGYAGQLTDPSGLLYMRARWYDPQAGRFLRRDPVAGAAAAPRTLNVYLYAMASPVMLTDPSGLCVPHPVLAAICGLLQRAAGFVPRIPLLQRAAPAVQRTEQLVEKTAYEIASEGGAHSGLLRNYATRSTGEIRTAIQSLESRAAEHLAKAENVAAAVDDWLLMEERAQAGLIRYWQREASRLQTEAEVLRGLLEEMRR